MPTPTTDSGHVQHLKLGPELRRRSDVLIEKGLTLAALARDDEALSAFDQALALHRTSPRAWYNKGLVLAKIGRYEEALAAFEAALARNQELAFLWLQKGLVLTALGRDDEAVVALDRAVALDPHDALAWRYRGAALFRLKRFEEALAAYDHTLQLDSDRTVAWRARGPAQKIEVPAEAANLGFDPVWSLAVGLPAGRLPRPDETLPTMRIPTVPTAPGVAPTTARPPARPEEEPTVRIPALRPSPHPAPSARPLPQPPTPAQPTAPAPADNLPARPRLASNIALHGAMKDAGFAQTQWLAERDGRFIQLTELVYRLAECCDGAHTLEEIAAQVRTRTGKNVSAENVRYLLVTRLLPAGFILGAGPEVSPEQGPAAAPQDQPRGLLSVNMRFAPFRPGLVNAVASVFQYAYLPPVLVTLLLLALAGQFWLFFIVRFDFTKALDTAFAQPVIVVATYGLVLVASLFHETGHASALRYGGARPRRIGMGLYMFFPVFFADVSENYRLGRWARVRTDLGGIYFNLLADLLLFAAYWLTHAQVYLLAVAATNLEVLYNLMPLGRYDGYWLLADLTGIPDFFSLMVPFLRSLPFFGWWHGPRLPALKPWVRAVYALYTLVIVPLLAGFFVLMLYAVPASVPALFESLRAVPAIVSDAVARHDVFGGLLSLGNILLLLLFVVAIAYSLISLVRSVVRMLFRLLRRVRIQIVTPAAS